MDTSVLITKRHYSNLKVIQAINELRGEQTRKLIDAGGVISEIYQVTTKKKVGKKGEMNI